MLSIYTGQTGIVSVVPQSSEWVIPFAPLYIGKNHILVRRMNGRNLYMDIFLFKCR
jgi:hypothetical protein